MVAESLPRCLNCWAECPADRLLYPAGRALFCCELCARAYNRGKARKAFLRAVAVGEPGPRRKPVVASDPPKLAHARRSRGSRIRASLARRDGRACRSCDSRYDLTIDHVTPRSRGGTSRMENLQLLCAPCNQRKGDADAQGVVAANI